LTQPAHPDFVDALARVRNLRWQLRRELDELPDGASPPESDGDWIARRLLNLDRAVEDVVERFVAGRVSGEQAARLLAALLPS